jgi:hypothetical protein
MIVRSRVRVTGHMTSFAFVAVLGVMLACAATAVAGPQNGTAGDTGAPSHVVVIDGAASMTDWAYAVVADRDGAYVGGFVARTSRNRDASLARVSSSGELEWLKTYDGPARGQDRLVALAMGPHGAIYGAGYTRTRYHRIDILVVKWRADGTRVWARTYDGGQGSDDTAASLGVDEHGDVTVAGQSSYPSLHGVVVRWTAAGRRTSVWRFSVSLVWDGQADVLVRNDGTAYVTSNTVLEGSPHGEAALTVKFSPSGRKLWQKLYAGPDGLGAHATAITGRPGGGVYVAGRTGAGADGSDGFVVRYAGSGAARVLPLAGLAGSRGFWDVTVTASGDIVAVGGESSASGGTNTGSVRIWTSEMAASVDDGGSKKPGDEFFAVAPDSAGGFYAAGEFDLPSAGRFLVHHNDPAAGGYRSEWPASSELGRGGACAVAVSGTTAYVVGTGNIDPAHRDDQIVLIYGD